MVAVLPTITGARAISIDCETYDPELPDSGPGWAWGGGYVVGVSVGVLAQCGRIDARYFSLRHLRSDNLRTTAFYPWLNQTLKDNPCPVVGANLTYDLGWLQCEGVTIKNKLIDVQFAEALLAEKDPVALDALGHKYLGLGKETDLYQTLADRFGGKPDGKQRANIWRVESSVVRAYAEQDAVLPLRLAACMIPILRARGLMRVFEMENGLIPLMIAMRMQGVRVDVNDAVQLRDKLWSKEQVEQKALNELAGHEVNVNAAASIGMAFDKHKLWYPRTMKTGAPSFKKEFLQHHEHPLAEAVLTVRTLNKLRTTFIDGYVLNGHKNGRLHGSFIQLRGGGGGTRSGRFASNKPNLQNLPSRGDVAADVRGLFKPNRGHSAWLKYDYSQVEYRMLLHHAVGQEGRRIRNYFTEHPDTDYHVMVQELVQRETGVWIERKPIKNINFGLVYGMGAAKLARSLGLSTARAKEIMAAYFKGADFVKPTMDAAAREAQELGYVTTVMGRRSYFDLWEPFEYSPDSPALPFEEALPEYKYIRRAHTHKALNRKLQGGAADMMKMAMLKCWEAGVFDETGIPLLTVHDELDFSDPGDRQDAFAEMRHIMETALPEILVPIKADGDIGPDWGHCEGI